VRRALERRRHAPDRRPDCLVVMGGDGMMHLGLNACAGTDVALGMVPAGTGNDLVRGLGLSARGPRDGIATVATGRTRQVDLIRVRGAEADGGDAEDVWVGSVVAAGFDAAVNRRANAMRWPRGSLRYATAALAELAGFAPVEYELVLDGEPRRLPAMLVAVGNGGYYGGGINICPDADPADGLLDITIVHPVSRPHLLAMLPLMYSRAFTRHPAVEQTRARRVELRHRDAAGDPLPVMGDGEPVGSSPVVLEATPRALTVFAPSA
uniref:diacylglycerol/lipid kinase family protein n=1 Tax=Desertihabitans aurantiacus TaxID=2282477 RepID=UPI0013004319